MFESEDLEFRRVIRLDLPLDELPSTVRSMVAEEVSSTLIHFPYPFPFPPQVILMMAEEVERRALALLAWLAKQDSIGLLRVEEAEEWLYND